MSDIGLLGVSLKETGVMKVGTGGHRPPQNHSLGSTVGHTVCS